MDWEFQVLDFIHDTCTSQVMDVLMPFVSSLGSKGLVWIGLAVVLSIIPKTRKLAAVMWLAMGLEILLCNLIMKPLFARIRPYDINTAVELIVRAPKDYSFPSGHTGISFAGASALFFGKSRLWIPALILACVMGFSRMYLYVHYPTDVLGGAALGIVCGYVAYRICERIMKDNGI